MASEVSCKNQNSSYRENILDQGKLNLVPVVGEFELTEYKWLKSNGVHSKGNGT